MASRDEQADILGGPILQRPGSSLFAPFAQYHFVFKSVTLLGLGLLVWIVCMHGLAHLKKHRELRYRKAMRRKHGIPDSDCRPFAVAYAAAKRAHLEREAQDRKKMATNYVSDHHSPAVDQRTDAQKDARGLRKRVPETIRLHDYQLPTKYVTVNDNMRPDVYSLNFADRYNPNSRRGVAIPEPLPVKGAPVRRASRKEFILSCDESEESRKRSFEDESDAGYETIKKSRIDGEELIDGDEEADWYAQYSDMPLRQESRGPLHHRLEADYVHANGQGRSQHINDLHDENHGLIDEVMEAILEDEVTELKAVVRGKKRDRTEAGSSFGGDEDEDARNGRAPHHRKRRTVPQTGMEVPARGRKRDREAESPGSEDERGGPEASQGRTQRGSRKKRGKKAASDEPGEVLMQDPRVSRGPICDGRRIGEEWEADGVQYKVGDKGERLRLTLVKKARNKYHMPEDSQHPDRSAALEIYVETWLTDEQYKQAERGQELAWQEAPRESKLPDVLGHPTKTGKNILWDSFTGSPARRSSRHLVPAGISTRINPFEQRQPQHTLQGRRVASSSTVVSPILPGVVDSPTRPGFRSFSKWEKQDREAEAMARIRAKIEEQKKAQLPPQKTAEISPSVNALELGLKPLSVPTITLTPAPTIAVEVGLADSIGQSKTNPSTFFPLPPSTNDSTKSTPTAAPTTSFSLPSVSASASTSSILFPSAPDVPIATSSTTPLPQLSFAKSSQAPYSTSTTASSPAIPAFFGKGTGVAMPSASAPLSSVMGATAQQCSTDSASKPAPFSFAKPELSTSSPVVTASSATKPQAPIFGAPSTSSLPSVSFGSTKTEASAPPPSTSVTTSESSKPTTPLFSFSGTHLSSSTTTFPAPSAPSVPKFSFGQSSTTSTLTPVLNVTPGVASQPKPTFKFGLTPANATDGASASSNPVADEPKKSAAPMPVSGTSASSNEAIKPLGTTFAGNAALGSPLTSATTSQGKPVVTDGGTSTSAPLKPSPAFVGFTNASLPTSGAPTPGNLQAFPFGGINPGPKAGDGSKLAPLFGGVAGSSTEGKPTFTFGASGEGPTPTFTSSGNAANSKPPPVFGGSSEGPRPGSAFGGSAETVKPISMFGGSAEGPKSILVSESKSTSGSATENPKSSGIIDTSKPNTVPNSTTFTVPTFAFGKKDDATTNPPTPMGAQTKPAPSFTFGAPSSATGSIFGQPSAFATNNDSSQLAFGKPANTTPSAFGFGGTGSSSSTFTFGKPAAQNQKQEQ